MALKVNYMARETASNLRRNLSMASAALLTVTVSLTLVGGALLVKRGVDQATIQWKGNVELSVFMKADATPEEIEAVDRQLQAMPEVNRYHFLNQEEAYAEFRQIFANEPDIRDSLPLEKTPPSFRVVPSDAEQARLIGSRFNLMAGVLEVSYAEDAIASLITVTSFLRIALWIVAIALLLAASLLILNTIRMAIFARRREVGIMKLVGATNWFIRVPFMVEGMIQGVAGAVLAVITVWVGRGFIEGRINDASGDIAVFKQFLVTPGDVVSTGVVLILVGAAVGILGSALAVRRFLEV